MLLGMFPRAHHVSYAWNPPYPKQPREPHAPPPRVGLIYLERSSYGAIAKRIEPFSSSIRAILLIRVSLCATLIGDQHSHLHGAIRFAIAPYEF